MKQFLLTLVAAAALAGCSSPVKLDDVPVQDRTGTIPSAATGTGTTGAAGGAVAESGVKSVDLGQGQATAAGPTGSRIVYFDFDSFVVRSEEQGTVENNARFLRADAKRRAVVEGHTDERGGREYNLALGQKRSEAVRRSLTLLGVQDSQVEAVSFGEEKPADPGHDEAAYTKNRRAEITYR